MMSIVFGGIILTIVFGGAERLFFGGRTLKRGTLLSLFAALLFTISPVVSVFGRAVSVPTVIYVFVSVAVGFYRGSGLDRLFLTYVSVLVGVFLYFYGEAKSVSLFSSDVFYSANGVLLEVALTVFWQNGVGRGRVCGNFGFYLCVSVHVFRKILPAFPRGNFFRFNVVPNFVCRNLHIRPKDCPPRCSRRGVYAGRSKKGVVFLKNDLQTIQK